MIKHFRLAVGVGIALFGLAACGPVDRPAAEGCRLTRTAPLTLSGVEGAERIDASAEGPSCGAAVVTLTVRTTDGRVLHTAAYPYLDLVGDRRAGVAEVKSEEVGALLDRLVAATPDTADGAPDWAEGAPNPILDGLVVRTPLDRAAYLALRESAAPRLCLPASAEAVQCLVYDLAQNRLIEQMRFGDQR